MQEEQDPNLGGRDSRSRSQQQVYSSMPKTVRFRIKPSTQRGQLPQAASSNTQNSNTSPVLNLKALHPTPNLQQMPQTQQREREAKLDQASKKVKAKYRLKHRKKNNDKPYSYEETKRSFWSNMTQIQNTLTSSLNKMKKSAKQDITQDLRQQVSQVVTSAQRKMQRINQHLDECFSKQKDFNLQQLSNQFQSLKPRYSMMMHQLKMLAARRVEVLAEREAASNLQVRCRIFKGDRQELAQLPMVVVLEQEVKGHTTPIFIGEVTPTFECNLYVENRMERVTLNCYISEASEEALREVKGLVVSPQVLRKFKSKIGTTISPVVSKGGISTGKSVCFDQIGGWLKKQVDIRSTSSTLSQQDETNRSVAEFISKITQISQNIRLNKHLPTFAPPQSDIIQQMSTQADPSDEVISLWSYWKSIVQQHQLILSAFVAAAKKDELAQLTQIRQAYLRMLKSKIHKNLKIEEELVSEAEIWFAANKAQIMAVNQPEYGSREAMMQDLLNTFSEQFSRVQPQQISFYCTYVRKLLQHQQEQNYNFLRYLTEGFFKLDSKQRNSLIMLQ